MKTKRENEKGEESKIKTSFIISSHVVKNNNVDLYKTNYAS